MSAPFKVRRVTSWIIRLLFFCLIGVLILILFPSPGGFEDAPRARGKNDASQLANAITAYLSEYGKLPTQGSGNVNSAGLMNTLNGSIPNDPSNSRQIVFLEIPKAKNHKNGVEWDEKWGFVSGYKDSWGNDYEIRIDNEGEGSSYDMKVKWPAGVVKKSVIVWSRGDPKKRDKYDDPAKWIKSWE